MGELIHLEDYRTTTWLWIISHKPI